MDAAVGRSRGCLPTPAARRTEIAPLAALWLGAAARESFVGGDRDGCVKETFRRGAKLLRASAFAASNAHLGGALPLMAPVDETLSAEDLAAGQASLRSLLTGFWGARAVHAAVRVDLFNALSARPQKTDEVAQSLRIDPRACEVLLNALVSLGLLEREEGAYKNSLVSKTLLASDSEYRQSSLARAFSDEWDAFGSLEETLRTGAPPRPVIPRDEDEINARRDEASVIAPLIVKKLDVSRVKRVLEIGAGPATYAIALAQASAGYEITVVDSQQRAPLAKQRIDEAGLGGRIRVETADPLNADFGTECYDLVLIPGLRLLSLDLAKPLVKRAFQATVSEGRCVIDDILLRDDRTGPLPATLLALEMLTRAGGARTYSGWEVTDLMQTEGFIRVQIIPLDPSAHSLVVGIRP